MSRKGSYNQAFAKHTPTAFIIESPFQMLCVWEAIEEFEIQDFRIVLVLEKNNIRNEQTFSMLQERGMEYDLYYVEDMSHAVKTVPGQENRRYDRVMLGDYDDLRILCMCSRYAAVNAKVIFMDDGISSIMILKNLPYRHTPMFARLRTLLKGPIGLERERREIFHIWENAGINEYNFFYTIYSQINSERFAVYPNTLSHLIKNSTHSAGSVILIVGTVIDDTAKELGIPSSLFEGLLWDKLVSVRNQYPEKTIIYIPHGRDYNTHIRQLCECLNIEYIRPKVSIEYFVVKQNLKVEAIFGNTSTALSTLRIMTNAPTTNWVIISPKSPTPYLTEQYAKFYEQMGIVTNSTYVPILTDTDIV